MYTKTLHPILNADGTFSVLFFFAEVEMEDQVSTELSAADHEDVMQSKMLSQIQEQQHHWSRVDKLKAKFDATTVATAAAAAATNVKEEAMEEGGGGGGGSDDDDDSSNSSGDEDFDELGWRSKGL